MFDIQPLDYAPDAPEGHPLNGAQFNYVAGHPTEHRVQAVSPEGKMLGQINWQKDTGEISNVNAFPQRQGIGTHLLQAAQFSGQQPAPQHSAKRTASGNAWAQKVGGQLPTRKRDAANGF